MIGLLVESWTSLESSHVFREPLMRISIRVLAKLTPVYLWVALSLTAPLRAQPEAQAMEAIVQVFNDNRDRFRSFSARFQVKRGIATSSEAAWREQFNPTYTQDGLLVAKNGDLRYELKCLNGELTMAEHAARRAAAPNTSPATGGGCASLGELFAQRQNMRITVSPLLKSVNLIESQPIEATHSPLSMGIMGPGDNYSPVAWIQGAKAGKYYCKYLGTDRVDDATVDVIECGLHPSDALQHKFVWYLDLSQGAIPRKRMSFRPDGSLRVETKATAIQRISNGGYICSKCISVGSDSPGRWEVWVISLTSIDTTEPTRDMLAIELGPEWKVVNVKDMRSFVKLEKAENLYLDDLPSWLARCDERLQAVIEEQTKLGFSATVTPTHAPPSRFGWWIAAGVVTAGAVGIALLVWRYVDR